MTHLFKIFSLTLTIAVSLTMCGCSNHSAAISQMVEELNSAEFRAAEAKTGLFADSEAKVEGESLQIIFICRPFIDLSSFSDDRLPELRDSAIGEFKANLVNQLFKQGIEALHDNGMTITLIWQDVYDHRIALSLTPSEILNATE